MFLRTLSYAFGSALSRRNSRFLPLCLNRIRVDKNRNYQSLCKYILFRGNTKVLPILPLTSVRKAGSFYEPTYTLKHLEERVMLVLKLYDKVNPDTITVDSHFYEDVGLDSLDHVEVIIAIEDEFDFEIPEEDHRRLMRPKEIIRYVADRFDVYE